MYLRFTDNKPVEGELPEGFVPNQWGNRPSGNEFLDIFTGLIRIHKHHPAKWYAHILGVEQVHFTGAIKIFCGMGVLDFINEYINLEAQELLDETDLSFQEIAKRLNLGPSEFSRLYKKLNKCQPSERRSVRKYGRSYRYRGN